jgi:hypothetical protein
MAPNSILEIPIDATVNLRPNRILYIVPQSGWARDTKILDLTSQLHNSYHDDLTPELKASAKRLASSTPPPAPVFTLTRAHWYSSSRLTITDTAGAQLAEWHSPIMAYGVTHIKFPEHSPHCSHALEVKPLSVARRAQSFIKDSATYVWETSGRFKSGRMSLYKAIGGKKIEVARYESDSSAFTAGGPLVLETREVDELVALLTCMAVLNQRDAFYKPGLDLGSRRYG